MLDKQIRDTIKQFAQVGSVVGHAETYGHLRALLQEGKRIVITTVQKFPFILDAIGNEHRGRKFAIIIDKAHSSQGGRTSASVSMALGEAGAEEEDETAEDKINRIMESRKLLANASYFAFTATPKNKTLEIFGMPVPDGGNTRHVPFHPYTLKQAIQERFIIDVLKDYTPVNSYYRLVKTVEGDPEFDTKRAGKKLRRYVEDHDHAIRLKAEIMVDHFHEQVAGLQKIGGHARAMVVTSSIQRAITYFYAIRDYLAERKSPYKAIAAFSGEHNYDGAKVTEASLNGFSSNLIADKIREDQYRFLVCADKFQTGYDEPLLHTMYVDKPLSSVKAGTDASPVSTGRIPRSTTPSCWTSPTTPTRSRTPSPLTTGPRFWRRRPTPTGCTISRQHWTAIKSTARRRLVNSWSGTFQEPTGTGSTRSWTPASRSTGSRWTKTARWTSRARRRRFSEPTGSWLPSCPTPMPSGRSSPSS